jgi:hypothetical protein
MKQKFRDTKLNAKSMEHLEAVNYIVEDYQSQGYKLTLRQLYYQLVSKNIIPNKDTEYKKLSRVLTEGRMAGFVDWDAIEDRLRQPQNIFHVSGIPNALNIIHNQYRLDRTIGQQTMVEVWVEKDAISNVLKPVTQKYGVNLLVNRGYGSATAMKDAYERYSRALRERYSYEPEDGDVMEVVILYLGDHDPSGLDMIRDIEDRISEMLSVDGLDVFFNVVPIALTKEQIRKYNPPPNPAKITDSRSDAYIAEHGRVSWEVDALPPNVLHKLLEDSIIEYLDVKKYNKIVKKEAEQKAEIKLFIDKYENENE